MQGIEQHHHAGQAQLAFMFAPRKRRVASGFGGYSARPSEPVPIIGKWTANRGGHRVGCSRNGCAPVGVPGRRMIQRQSADRSAKGFFEESLVDCRT